MGMQHKEKDPKEKHAINSTKQRNKSKRMASIAFTFLMLLVTYPYQRQQHCTCDSK